MVNIETEKLVDNILGSVSYGADLDFFITEDWDLVNKEENKIESPEEVVNAKDKKFSRITFTFSGEELNLIFSVLGKTNPATALLNLCRKELKRIKRKEDRK